MLEKLRFNRKAGIFYLILVSVVLAVPLFWLAWVYLPVQIFEYRFTDITEKMQRGKFARFYDLDGDEIGEEVILQNYREGHYHVEVYDLKGSMLNTFRVYGNNIPRSTHTVVGDYNADNRSEIYNISLNEDSVFLSGHIGLGDKEIFKPLKLDSAGLSQGKTDISVMGFKLMDVNSDGFKDLYVAIRAAFSRYPRRIYVYDIHNKTLKRSKPFGSVSDCTIIDSDNDGKMEYYCGTHALMNHKPENKILFNDNTGWFFALDDDLQTFLFPPVKYHLEKPFATTFLLEEDNTKYMGVFVYDYNNVESKILLKYNLRGELLDSLAINSSEFLWVYNQHLGIKDKVVLADRYSNAIVYSTGFEFEEKLDIDVRRTSRHDTPLAQIGLYIAFQPDNSLLLYDKDFKIKGQLNLSVWGNPKFYHHSIISKSESRINMAFHTPDRKTYLCTLKKSSFYPFRYLVYVFYFLFLSSLLFVLLGVPLYFSLSRSRIEKKMNDFQLQAIQNQLQPHFTFNMLSSVGGLIYTEEKEQAYKTLNEFSELLRTILIHSKGGDWNLQQEMDFINIYLKLQNSRFEGKFQIEQNIRVDNLQQRKVPKMIVQSYVENAIKHGLAHKKENCNLWINIDEMDEHLVIVVRDNGIGRKQAEEISRQGTGQGMRIWSDFFKSYNRINKVGFEVKVEDVEEGESGTRVRIKVPIDYMG